MAHIRHLACDFPPLELTSTQKPAFQYAATLDVLHNSRRKHDWVDRHSMTYIVPSHPSPPPTPPRTALLQNLTSQSQFLLQLFTLLSSTAPLPTLPPPTPLPPSQLPHPASTSSPATSSNPISRLYSSLQTSTLELAHILDSVHAHQAAYRELDRQKLSVIGLEYQVHELVRSLETGRRELEVMVEDGKEVRKSIEKVNLSMFPLFHLIKTYA